MIQDNIIVDNQALITKVIKDMNLICKTKDEWQEYFDDGLIGLINGARTYNEEKNVMLSTYLYTCIRRAIITGIINSKADKRVINKHTMLSLDKQLKEDDETTFLEMLIDDRINIEKQIEDKLMYEEIIKAVDYVKPQYLADMFCRYYGLKGYKKETLVDIGKLYGLSRQSVFGKIRRAEEKINKIINKKDNKRRYL